MRLCGHFQTPCTISASAASPSVDCKELVSCEHFGPEYDAEEDSSTVSTTKESVRGMRTTSTVEETAAAVSKPQRPASSYGIIYFAYFMHFTA